MKHDPGFVRGLALCVVLLASVPPVLTQPAFADSSNGGNSEWLQHRLRAHAGSGTTRERGEDHSRRDGRKHTPGVVPPQARPFGRSYADWSARHWQWLYSLPTTGHPLVGTDNDCARGQSGPVWFLGGVFTVNGGTPDPAPQRFCTVPEDKALFFPILDAEWDNVCPPNDPPLSADELAAIVGSVLDRAADLSLEIDGRSVDVSGFRVQAGPFDVTFPDDNLFQAFGCDVPPGSYRPFLSDGYFVMLTPLSEGQHTIRFAGSIVFDDGTFAINTTYHLTVTHSSKSAVQAAQLGVTGGDLSLLPAPTQRATWGSVKAMYR